MKKALLFFDYIQGFLKANQLKPLMVTAEQANSSETTACENERKAFLKSIFLHN
jgi:hypothetical protein